MKKYILIVIPFIFWGCQKSYNTVVDSQSTSPHVVKITTADSFIYNQKDSTITISVQLNSSMGVKSVGANIIESDFTQLNTEPLILYDNGDVADNGDLVKGDNIFSNKFPMSVNYPNGSYTVQYFITDENDNSLMAAVHSFGYSNLQTNKAPVISSLSAPDTVTIESQAIALTVSIHVSDGNGLSDINTVSFNSFVPPDGHASSANPIIMYDDGQAAHGDAAAGDGIYTVIVQLPATGVPKGTFRWEFQAVDKEGLTSNKITHNLVVQ
jgi:hypothetical protein